MLWIIIKYYFMYNYYCTIDCVRTELFQIELHVVVFLHLETSSMISVIA
jgi:hypothetical protein